MCRSVGSDIQSRRRNISITKGSVSSIIRYSRPRSYISSTSGSVSSDIQTLREVFDSKSKHRKLICKTRDTVIHPISRHRELICQTRVGVLNRWSDILNREVIYQTRGVFHPKSKHLQVIYQMREVFKTLSRHLKVRHQTLTISVFKSDIKTRKSNIQNTRECIKLYTQSLQSNILDTRRSNI